MYYFLLGPDLLPRAQSEISCHEEAEVNEGERMLSLGLLDGVSILSALFESQGLFQAHKYKHVPLIKRKGGKKYHICRCVLSH